MEPRSKKVSHIGKSLMTGKIIILPTDNRQRNKEIFKVLLKDKLKSHR